MENIPLMMNKRKNQTKPDYPSYCAQLSCTDPQTGLLKCLQNEDLTTFSTILAEEADLDDEAFKDSANSRLLSDEHWINSYLYEDDKTILQLALEAKQFAFCQKLIDVGVKANFFNAELDMALIHVAVLSGDIKEVEILLGTSWNKADVSVTTQPDGSNCLHLAADNYDLLKRLLQEPAVKVNAKDNCGGRTPLYLAAKAENLNCVRLLIEHGADPDIVVERRKIRDLIRQKFPDLDLAKIEVKVQPNRFNAENLCDVFDRRDLVVFKSALAFIDPQEVSSAVVRGGFTLMQKAAIEGAPEYVQALLKHGVNPNYTTIENPVHPVLLCASRAHSEVLSVLLNSVNSKTVLGVWTSDTQETILHLILKRGLKSKYIKAELEYDECLNILLKNDRYHEALKPIINKKDYLHNTPLHYASEYWSQKVVWELLKLGANIAIRNLKREIPLRKIPPETLKAFLDKDCTLPLEDPDDTTKNFQVTFKYDFLAPPVTEEQLKNWDQEKQSQLEREALPETDTLWYISQSKSHRSLITHPVLISFMWLKWQRFRRILNRNLKFYTLFVFLLTWYVFARFGGKSLGIREQSRKFCSELSIDEMDYGFFYWIFLLQCLVQTGFILRDWITDYRQNGSRLCILGSYMELIMLLTFAIGLYGSLGILKWLVVVYLILIIIRETFQLISSFQRYYTSLENWIEVSMITILLIIWFYDAIPCSWARHLAALSILFSWAELITLVGRHPKLIRYNIYVTMFYKVIESFTYFLLWFSFFIVAFAFGFYIMLHKDESDVYVPSNYTFFDSPGLSLVKTFTMFVGEIEFSDIPVEVEDEFSILPYVSYGFLLAFVFFIVVVLMNLLNGLAIADTGSIQSMAELYSYISRIKSVSYVESVLLGDPFDFLASSSGNFNKRMLKGTILNSLYSSSPTLRYFMNKITGATGILLFYSLLPDKSATFPDVAQRILGRENSNNSELYDIIEGAKDVVRSKGESNEQDSMKEMFKLQIQMMKLMQQQQEDIKALKIKLNRI